jgi:hypothetical protein
MFKIRNNCIYIWPIKFLAALTYVVLLIWPFYIYVISTINDLFSIYDMKYIVKLHYVINHIIVKIHNNYKFCLNKRNGQSLCKKIKVTNIWG